MIILSAIILFGLITIKEFRFGVLTLIGSAVVFTFVIAIGVIFNLFYPCYMAFKERDVKVFFIKWWRLIRGTYRTVGKTLWAIAVDYDILGNVWGGEAAEDSLTTEENTMFGEDGVIMSAATGHLEYNKLFMFKRGKQLSKVLNFVFHQTRHCIGSWEKYLAIKEIDRKNLHGNKKK